MDNQPEGWDEDPQEQSVPQEEDAGESVLREEQEKAVDRLEEFKRQNYD